ncbi:hypothetical protein ANO14919_057500 [Xylariales sp. No.14919]|nr:hypothetical protein ANO14919_057500 [Xylariales sp. No.14919]
MRHQVRTLRQVLTRDIAALYDARVPYRINTESMVIARISSRRLQRKVYKPLVDAFNLDVDPEDASIDWAALKEKAIRSAEAQLAVIENFHVTSLSPCCRLGDAKSILSLKLIDYIEDSLNLQDTVLIVVAELRSPRMVFIQNEEIVITPKAKVRSTALDPYLAKDDTA